MNLSSRKKRIILEIFLTVAIMCELLYAISLATKVSVSSACIIAFCLGFSVATTVLDISIYKSLCEIKKELDKAMREAKEITQRENVDDILKVANENLKEEGTKENV